MSDEPDLLDSREVRLSVLISIIILIRQFSQLFKEARRLGMWLRERLDPLPDVTRRLLGGFEPSHLRMVLPLGHSVRMLCQIS